MHKLAKALSMAAQAFENTLDKGGQPYFLHCLRVMHGCGSEDEDVLCAAVLHDYVEDAPNNEEAERRLVECTSLSRRVLTLVAVLTHDSGMASYDDYIKLISHDRDATKIKLADLVDNSNITRLKGLRKKDLDRIEKYHRAYTYLSGV